MSLFDELRMDRTHFAVVSFAEPDSAITYWQSKTPDERLEAVEFLRQVAYGYDPATARLQRVLAVIRREGR